MVASPASAKHRREFVKSSGSACQIGRDVKVLRDEIDPEVYSHH